MAKSGNGAIANVEEAQALMEKGDKAELWPQDMKPQEKKQLAYIASQYGLDPFFSDLTVLGGQPYVTASGLKRNAHESDDPPVSIQLERVQSEGNRHFEYVAKLWKQSTPEDRPFVEYGEASPQDCNSMISRTDKDLKAMARTRAVNRVLRLAYNINITSAEELSGYDPDSQEIEDVTPEQQDPDNAGNGKQAQTNDDLLNRIYELMDRKQASQQEINNWLKDQFQISLGHLSQPKYAKVANKLIEILEGREDAQKQEETEEVTEEDLDEVREDLETEELPF